MATKKTTRRKANSGGSATDHLDTSPSYHPKGGTSTEVRSPTSTRTEVRSPTETSTSTSTDAYTAGNLTVTGGAGRGAYTDVTVYQHKMPESDRGSQKATRKPWDGVPAVHAANPRRRRSNPADGASDLFQEFHGVPSEKVLEYVTRFHVHEHLAGLGRLVELVFITPGARQRQVTMTEDDFGQGVWLCASEDAKSLYIIGPVVIDLEELGYRPDVDVKDAVELGRLTNVVYKTKKEMNNLDLIEYDHELGKRERWQKRDGVGPEMNKEVAACPLLIYHTRENRLSVAGGQYLVMDIGITN